METAPHLEEEVVRVSRFIWSDGDYKLPAGELLGVLLELLNTHHPTIDIPDSDISSYLASRGHIELVGDGRYALKGTHKAIEDLGSTITSFIDKTITELPPGTIVALCPAVYKPGP